MKTFTTFAVLLLVSSVCCIPHQRQPQIRGLSRDDFIKANCQLETSGVENAQDVIPPQTVTIQTLKNEVLTDTDMPALVAEMQAGLSTATKDWLEAERTKVICTLARAGEMSIREVVSGDGRICPDGPEASTRDEIIECVKTNLDKMDTLGSAIVKATSPDVAAPTTIRCTYTINRIDNGLDKLLAKSEGSTEEMYQQFRRTLAELQRGASSEESKLKPHSALVPYIEENCPEDVKATWVQTKLKPLTYEDIGKDFSKVDFSWITKLRENIATDNVESWIAEEWDKIACDLGAIMQFVIRVIISPGGGETLDCGGLDPTTCLTQELGAISSGLDKVRSYADDGSVEDLAVDVYSVLRSAGRIELLLNQLLAPEDKVRELVNMLEDIIH